MSKTYSPYLEQFFWALGFIIVVGYALIPVMWIMSLSLKQPGDLADGRFLVPSILENGMQERPWVTPIPNSDNVEIVRGHSRMDAQDIISNEYPERHAELFPNGKIKVLLVTEVSEDEKNILKMDFTRRNLNDKYEIQNAASLLFDSGCTEGEVANHLAPMLGEIVGKRKAKITELEEALAKAESPADRVSLQHAISDEVAQYRRGKVQGLKNIWRCPYIVTDCLYFEVYGKNPDHYEEGAVLPVLTQAEVRKLAKAYDNDLTAFENKEISERPTKLRPGKNFLELFESICLEKQGNAEKKESEPVKSMSRNDIVKPLKEGNIDSSTMADVINFHGADKSVSADVIKKADNLLAVAEFAIANMPEEWEAINTAFQSYRKKLQASAVRAESRNAKNDK